jgi:formylglycine-generating enzyme required for sulfatase activity
LTSTLVLTAQEARFFRVAGPVASTITAISADGYITWTNAPTNATFTVQAALSLQGQNNWVPWTQLAVTNPLTTVRVFAAKPPDGMVLIPAGSFTMGDNLDGTPEALPLHTNFVSAFYMDRYETTKAKWDAVYQWATNHGYTFTALAPGAKGTNHPVHTVNWFNRVKWCNARSELEGLDPCYYTTAGQTNILRTGSFVLSNACVRWSANGYRLPTEAEWEKAARGGANGNRFPLGDTISHSQVNYYGAPSSFTFDISPTSGFHPDFDDVEPYTSPVGYFEPNAYGLYDMAGNLWEWCWDVYEAYSSEAQIDPNGPSVALAAGGVPKNRILRGGGWGADAMFARCADRAQGPPNNAGYTAGSRCVRGL